MKVWFSSDYHLGHANIIKYCKRHFKNLEQMDRTIINNHNSRVKPDDTVFFLGDFCFKNTKGGKKGEGELNNAEYYMNQLNGRFVFIRGNHDNNNSLKTNILNAVIEIGGEEIFLVHNPTDINCKYGFNFVGHVHEMWKFKRFKSTVLVNLSCDVWKFMPVDINEIMGEYTKWVKENSAF